MKSTSHGDVELPHQVREEEDGPLEHADQQQARGPRSRREICSPSSSHAVRQVVLLDEDLADRRGPSSGASLGRLRARHAPAPMRPIAPGPSSPAAKRSSSATPATHTISPARLDHGQRAAQRARHLAVGEQVLERLGAARGRPGASGRPRARLRTSSPAAQRGGGHASTSPGSPAPASTSQSPEPRRARARAASTGSGGAGVLAPCVGSAACRTPPPRAGRRRGRATRAAAPPEAQRPRRPRGARASRGRPAASSASRAQHQPAQRRRAARAQAPSAHRRAAAEASSASAAARSSTSASSRSSRAVSAIVRSAAGEQRAQRRQDLCAHARAREARILVRGVLAPGQPARPAVLPRLLAGGLQQRAHQAPAPRGASRSSARRPGETASR